MKRYLVVGLGATGQSVIEFLQQQDPQNKLIGFDTRADMDINSINRKFPKLEYYLGNMDLALLATIDQLIVSPGFALSHPLIEAAQQQALPIMGDIELFYHYAQAPIIGITGTNAKSTVTTLVTEMINATGKKALMGGNIGVPALKLLDAPVPDYYVLELSSFQLELTQTLSCLTAVILNLSPDHLDRHDSLFAYQKAKERVYLNCEHPVYFRNMRYQHSLKPEAFTFAEDSPKRACDFGIMTHEGNAYLARATQLLLKVSDLGPGLFGAHNVINSLSALALLAPLGLELEPQLAILKTFKGLPHRCVLVRTLNAVRWFNDSKGTNIGATEAAIKGLAQQAKGRMILILGGVGKSQDFGLLAEVVQKYISYTIIFGADKQMIATALDGQACTVVNTLDEVISHAYHFARPDDIVLFSPACASYDMFDHYEHRGQVFADKVNQL